MGKDNKGPGGRKRPPGRWDKPPSGPGHGKGTRHGGGMCRLGQAVAAVILLYLAAVTISIAGAW